MQNIDEKVLEQIVRKIIEEKLGNVAQCKKEDFVKNVDPSGIMSIVLDTVKPEKFDTGSPSEEVYLKDVVSLEESPRLGCGVMEMKESTFKWTLKYDEINYVIDGTLEIDIDGRRVVGNKGDMILIPKDSSITFTVPTSARWMYVCYPANWADQ